MIVEICTASAIAGLVIFIYLGFFWKINWIRDMTIEATKSTSLMAKYKRKKSRAIGELPPVFPNGWFGLLESSALKKGEVQHVPALGQNFAVFRTESGMARVVDAYCPHLGANMAEGGQVIGEELECHFHSWRFCGKTGKCTVIPYSKSVPEIIKTKAWEICETNGVIFVWYHAESEPPNWWPEPVEEITNGKWIYQGRNEFYLNCHIQEIPENGSDWAHLSAIHGASMVASNLLSKVAYHAWTNVSWATKSSLSQKQSSDLDDSDKKKNTKTKEDNEKHKGVIHLTHSFVLFNKITLLKLDVVATQIGPGFVELSVQSAFGPIYIVQTVTPLQPLLQRVVHRMYAPFLLSPYCRIVLIGESIMFERDILVWNYKKYLENPKLVSEDRTIKAFRRWYKQFYSKNSPTYESCTKSVEW